MGDEDHRLLVVAQEVEQVFLELAPRCSSTEENGSSIRMMSAFTVSARARPTRWRMPPESWSGWRCSKPLRPTSAMYLRAISSRSGRHARSEAEGDVAHVRPRQQGKILEHEGVRPPGRPPAFP